MIGMVAGMLVAAPLARMGSAVSPEATISKQAMSNLARAAESSLSLFGRKSAALASLHEMGEECAVGGWDGDGAAGVSPVALAQARNVIRAMPDGLPLPEFAPEPDGSVSLEWTVSRHRRFLVSVGEGDRLAYAWVNGINRGHAVARFDGGTIPSHILRTLESIVSHDGATVRVA